MEGQGQLKWERDSSNLTYCIRKIVSKWFDERRKKTYLIGKCLMWRKKLMGIGGGEDSQLANFTGHIFRIINFTARHIFLIHGVCKRGLKNDWLGFLGSFSPLWWFDIYYGIYSIIYPRGWGDYCITKIVLYIGFKYSNFFSLQEMNMYHRDCRCWVWSTSIAGAEVVPLWLQVLSLYHCDCRCWVCTTVRCLMKRWLRPSCRWLLLPL